MDWQPIETAPKMRQILLFVRTDEPKGNYRMESGYFHKGYKDEPGEWRWGGHRIEPWEHQPTHWMEMPDPPTDTQASHEPE